MRRFMAIVIAALWMVTLLPLTAMAQTKEPGPLPDGDNLTFIPNVLKAAPRPWSAPELVLLHAGNTQVRSATADAWCVNLLDASMVQAASEVCLGGTLYPALVNKDVAVSAAGWQDQNAIAVEGEPLRYTKPEVLNKRVLFSSVLFDEGPLFVWGKEQQVGIIPIFLSDQVTSASITQENPVDEIELFRKLNRMAPDVMRAIGVPVPANFPVFNFRGDYFTTLGGLCLKDLDGHSTWPWYFMDIIAGESGPLLAGEWAQNEGFIPGFQLRLRSCMLDYKYFRWDQLKNDAVFATFREAVMASEPVHVPRFPVYSWGDSQLGGNWYFQIIPAGGAVIVAAQYMQEIAGVLQPVANVANGVMAWLIIPNPDSNLLCGVFGDPDTCTLKQIQ